MPIFNQTLTLADAKVLLFFLVAKVCLPYDDIRLRAGSFCHLATIRFTFVSAKIRYLILSSITISPIGCKWRCNVCKWRCACRCQHCFQSVLTKKKRHVEATCYSRCAWQNTEIITHFKSNWQVQSVNWGNRIQLLVRTNRAHYFCTR